ncbi:14017_t:CDS:2, partial [Entrophospora sp. SA101]
DKYQWFSAPEHLTSTASYKSLDNGAFVYRHIFMDEFQEEFNVKPIQFPNETEEYIHQSISASSERYAPYISSFKKRVEEGTYVDDGSVYVRWVNDDVRYGMFAGKDFKPGDVIGIYAGLITPSSNDLEYEYIRKHNLTFRLKNETEEYIHQSISASSERYAPYISSFKKRVEEGTYVDDGSVYVRWVNDDVRYGMFAGKDFKPGDVIGIYAGLITPSSNDLEYAWEYNYLVDVKDEDGEKIAVCIDGKHSGNYMRFANHRDDNQNGGQLYVVHDDMWNVVYTAHTHIKTHEQIFVNYGQAYWNIVIVVNSDDGDESVEANFF